LLALAAATLLPGGVGTAAGNKSAVTGEEVLSAVVGVRAQIPADARTAATLGTEREGSGVVIDDNGLVLTIGYLILEANKVEVSGEDGRAIPAEVIAYHSETGFGLLRATAPLDIKPMRLGKSHPVSERQPVLVAAHGGAEAAMPGIVVSRRDFSGYWEYLLEGAIFTSPPHPQFSGAALVNADGKLIGIGSLIVGDAIEPQVYFPGNMFVPIDKLPPILADLLTEGVPPKPRRPWLGIYTEQMEGRLLVNRVAQGGPAQLAGVRPGDIVVGVGGKPIRDQGDFYRKLWASGSAGDHVSLNLLQGSKIREVTVESADRYQWLRLHRSF
jgi:S1-C subfamily serine protease